MTWAEEAMTSQRRLETLERDLPVESSAHLEPSERDDLSVCLETIFINKEY